MEEQTPIVRSVEREHGSVVTYTAGFVLSVVLTLVAFLMASRHSFKLHTLMAVLIGLAVIQFVIQLVFFLHIGRESKPRWKQLLLALMLIFVLIVVLGSILVMYSLNNRMTPGQINTYMMNQAESGL